MKISLFAFLFLIGLTTIAQEFDSDLYATLTYNTLNDFMESDKRKMTVTTYRNSEKQGLIEELETKYKKGILFENRITFNTKYSDHYMVEDRKKSLGKYDIKDGQVIRYQRTDFNNDNLRKNTFFHFYKYDQGILEKENIRIWEYGQGSVEVDSTVYLDSALFKVSNTDKGYKQKISNKENQYTLYHIENDKLIEKITVLNNFKEVSTFVYNTKGQVVKIKNEITNKNGKTLSNRSELFYTLEGLLSEVKFYDESGELLEKKTFSYK